jgi:chromosome segregation ATPase
MENAMSDDGRDDLTVRVLIEIRDEIRATNTRIDQTNSRLDQTNVNLDRHTNRLDKRIDDTRADLSRRLAEVEIRTVTALNDVHGTLREVRDLLRDRLDLRDRVDRVERDVAELKRDRKG